MKELTSSEEVPFAEIVCDNLNTLKLESVSFVLFGATGDLAKRKIFPALYNLFLDEKLSKPFLIIGLGRRKWTDEDFQFHIKESLSQFSRRFIDNDAHLEEFLQAFRYCSLDVTDSEGYERVLKLMQSHEEEWNMSGNRLFYLSVAPEFFDVISSHIQKSGLGSSKGWKRLIIEKPFGHDLKSAQELNEKLSKAFAENEIYRIDHYLGKSMVQSLESLKTANPIIRSIFNNKSVSNVQITASETVGVEERAGYYDQAGAIRDMFQNHMLQLLMMTAMQAPESMSPECIRSEKRKIMESLRPIGKEEVISQVIRGQYSSGEINNQPVVAYKEEPGVEEFSANDTFVAARLWIDSEAWKGVPFYIRTGKRMGKKSTRIVVEFKDTSESEQPNVIPNLLTIEISPNESVSLQLNLKNPLNYGEIEPLTLDFTAPSKEVPEAYESLIYSALRGDPTFFAHWKEVELSWMWVQPVLEAFEANTLPLHSYRSGSAGPAAADQLLEINGFKWW